jgi:hypothetical protein
MYCATTLTNWQARKSQDEVAACVKPYAVPTALSGIGSIDHL